jgi:NAD(P)-dependent dehydrogenase (short-subunit alcohol dehydrogenase family)
MSPTLLVFGARNLGRLLAADLATDGWNAAAVARSDETITALREAVPAALGIAGDATRADDVERAFAETRERFGGVDLVVNAMTPTPRGSFGGGPIGETPADALAPYVEEFLPAVFHVLRVAARTLVDGGGGTFVQLTGGSARRGIPGRGPWAAAAFATRAFSQSAAQELRERGVHVALLIVDAVIASPKTAGMLADRPEDASAAQEDIVAAIRYLASQSPRAWTHELQLTPRLERWVP